jgi:NAD(P)-dependent dehydrogenase (short-subunit alcohol dehydrogenase family)
MAQQENLAGKVVAITGGGRGIGRAIALLCAREGAAVVVNDFGGSLAGDGHDSGPASEVVKEIKAMGGQAHANVADITDAIGASTIMTDAIEQFGRIDAVVNNAGVSRDGMFHKMSSVNWQAVVDVHLGGSYNVSRAAAPYFRDQGSGSYIHMTSTSGLIGNVGQSNYSSAKMAILGLSNSIALDMRRYGVRSNCVAPFAWSRMTDSIPADTPEAIERIERLKGMTADKVAPMVGYLCSDLGSEVSGQIFCVRKNEIFLFQMPRPVRSMHRDAGWTVDSIGSDLMPAFNSSLSPLQVSADIFTWDPI